MDKELIVAEGLTEKEFMFCELVLSGVRKLAAYERAGFKPCNKEVYKLCAKPSIQNYLNRRRAEMLEQFKIQQNGVLMELLDIKKRCEESGNIKEELKALDMMCKILGLYAPTKSIVKTESNFTDEDINELLNGKGNEN